MMTTDDLVLVGHPYAPIGMGEHVRCSYRAFRSVAVAPRLHDIYRMNEPDEGMRAEFADALTDRLGAVNVWHINGDEVKPVLERMDSVRAPGSYDIVYPAWELARYPREWAEQLERFDEVWTPTDFIRDAIAPAVSKPVVSMPLACEVLLTGFLGRRAFGIPEDHYAFLFFFDFRSYASRKNPGAVVEAFERAVRERPTARTSLVIKLNGAENEPQAHAELAERLRPLAGRVVLLARTMSDNEVKNLVRACDCFVSLHRSEGFGRGLSEAMFLGKPVIGTGYSGNMQFMTPATSLIVDHRLVPVPAGAYPHWQDQVWAEPDVAQAARHMVTLLDDRSLGRRLGEAASLALREGFGYRPVGMRYLDRLETLGILR